LESEKEGDKWEDQDICEFIALEYSSESGVVYTGLILLRIEMGEGLL
jgi:hypothetical protein